MPAFFSQKLQDMEEKRIERLGVCMKTFADVDRQVLPIVGKCLDGMTKAAESIEPKTVSMQTEIYMDTHTHAHTHTHHHMGHITHSARVSVTTHRRPIKLSSEQQVCHWVGSL